MPQGDMVTADFNTQHAAYTPRQIYLAAFLGSPISAAWFIRKNFLLAGDFNRASKAIWRSIVLTTGLLTISLLLPDRFPKYVIPLLYSWAIHLYANSVFEKPVKVHLEQGGQKGSWWEVVGISVLSLVVLLAAAFVVIYTLALFGLPSVDSSDT